MFINFSNHPVEKWGKEQLEAAKEIGGEVVDFPFPAVPERASSEQVKEMAEDIAEEIIKLRPQGVMAQGEFTLVHNVVCLLKEAGIPVFAGCSERKVVELEDGKKIVEFQFAQFREY